MSEKQFSYKQRLRRLDLKKIQATEKLVTKSAILIGALLLLIALIVTLLRDL